MNNIPADQLDKMAENVAHRALEVSQGPEREAYLRSACGTDHSLSERVQCLLRFHEKVFGPSNAASEPEIRVLNAAIVRNSPVETETKTDPPTHQTKNQIGPYRILQKLGEGGCGVVYMAEQHSPIQRRVALKVIKPGMDSKSVVARFESERQALAMMDHPNIAKVLDAGTTDINVEEGTSPHSATLVSGHGLPFFVMELIRGIKITEYCDLHQLSTAERLGLFVTVCQAVQHAHQKGIIHRDIKPSNVLVTVNDGIAMPKVIDFGIAKAIQGRLTDKTLFTEIDRFIGTPDYMSPEQAELTNLDIDTRADIYSLGVLLYELLTGKTPFETRSILSLGIDALRRTIREQEPPRPSTRLATMADDEKSTTAKRRSIDPTGLVHQLKGDLDWIVLKCLEKDRSRRYDTANGLALDVQRHLNNEPVLARPSSTWYRVTRTAKRNRAAFAAAAVTLIALIAGLVTSMISLSREKEASLRAMEAERAAEKARNTESKLRDEAEQKEAKARERAYAADISLAQQSLALNNMGRARELLMHHAPLPGKQDLRGWEWRYLFQYCQSDAAFTLCNRTNNIWGLSVSHDGKWAAVGEHEFGHLTVWDLEARTMFAKLPAGISDCTPAFSPQQPLLAYTCNLGQNAANHKTVLRLWNLQTSSQVFEAPLEGPCHNLAFSPDGHTLVTCTTYPGNKITLWNIPEGSKRSAWPAFQVNSDSATPFALDRKLRFAVHSPLPGVIRVIDLATGKELWSTRATDESVMSVALSPDGERLAAGFGFSDSTIKLFEASTGKLQGTLLGHRAWVSSLLFLDDGKTLVSGSADQTIRLWDASSLKPIRSLHGHQLEVWRLALTPKGDTLLSGGKNGEVLAWSLDSSRRRNPHSKLKGHFLGRFLDWCFGDRGDELLFLDFSAQVKLWRPGGETEILFKVPTSLASVHLDSSNMLAIIGLRSGRFEVWDLRTRALRHAFETTHTNSSTLSVIRNGTGWLVFNPSAQTLEDWNLLTGQRLKSWTVPDQISAASLSPDEQSWAALGWRGSNLVLNLKTGEHIGFSLNLVRSLGSQFSPDGKWFAAATEQGFARLWKLPEWTEAATLGGFLLGVHGVGWSADGNRLAATSGIQESVRLWTTGSWLELLNLEGEGWNFQNPRFSKDGNSLAASSERGLHVWNAPSWNEIDAMLKSNTSN